MATIPRVSKKLAANLEVSKVPAMLKRVFKKLVMIPRVSRKLAVNLEGLKGAGNTPEGLKEAGGNPESLEEAGHDPRVSKMQAMTETPLLSLPRTRRDPNIL